MSILCLISTLEAFQRHLFFSERIIFLRTELPAIRSSMYIVHICKFKFRKPGILRYRNFNSSFICFTHYLCLISSVYSKVGESNKTVFNKNNKGVELKLQSSFVSGDNHKSVFNICLSGVLLSQI